MIQRKQSRAQGQRGHGGRKHEYTTSNFTTFRLQRGSHSGGRSRSRHAVRYGSFQEPWYVWSPGPPTIYPERCSASSGGYVCERRVELVLKLAPHTARRVLGFQLEAHCDLVDATLDLALKDEPNKQLLDLLVLNV